MSKKASIIIHVNEDGEIISAKNVDLSEIQYDPDEKRKIDGARIYTPNGCCWKLTSSGWKCLTCP